MEVSGTIPYLLEAYRPLQYSKKAFEETPTELTFAFGLDDSHEGIKRVNLFGFLDDFGQIGVTFIRTPHEGEYLVNYVGLGILFNKSTKFRANVIILDF